MQILLFLGSLALVSFLSMSVSLSISETFRSYLSGSYRWHDPAKITELSDSAKQTLDKSLEALPAIVDTHMHIVCKQEDNGCFINDRIFESLAHPVSNMRSQVMLSALGASDLHQSDDQMVQRLYGLVKHFPKIPYHGWYLAFSAKHDEKTGEKLRSESGLEVPNKYVEDVLAKFPTPSTLVASLHPFQKDLSKQLVHLKDKGVRFIKVLPNSMGFAPDHPACELFFRLLAEHNFVLLTHVGNEHTVEGGGIVNEYGNPLSYEKWLKLFPKLKIIFAHLGSDGDTMVDGKTVDHFDSVLNLMDQYPKQTYGDLSAFAIAPNRVKYLPRVLEESRFHNRLLYGSDYPLPAVLPLIRLSLYLMYRESLLGSWKQYRDFEKQIMEIYRYNPLAASFVVLRRISYKGRYLPDKVFYHNAMILMNGDKG